jgi:cytochrome c
MPTQRFSISAAGIILAVSCIALVSGCEKKEATPPSPAAAVEQPTPAPSKTAGITDPEAAIKSSDCLTCHTVDKKLVGPPYEWIAFRFKDDKDAVAKLTKAIKDGSSGQWTAYTNGVPMTPHPQLSDAELKSMVEWILSQKPVEPPKS